MEAEYCNWLQCVMRCRWCECMPFPCCGDALGRPEQLVEPWQQLVCSGEIFTALVLSTLYSEKYKGRDMVVGDTAEVRLPAPMGSCPALWSPTLLHRAGSKEVSVFIWRGDEGSSNKFIYLAFSPLRKSAQFFKIMGAGATLVEDTFTETRGDAAASVEHTVRMFSYVQKKLQNLWLKYGFQEKLEATMAEYPDHLLLCCGISHGAALAQALALKLSLVYPRHRFQAVTWNAYKWMDVGSAALMRATVGKRLLSFVLSRRHYWDSVAGVPYHLEPAPHIVFLDADTGACRPAGDVRRTRLGPCSAWRMYNLHFAKTALKATRLATLAAMAGSRQQLGSVHAFKRAWSLGRAVGSALTEQEAELASLERRVWDEDEEGE